MLKAWFSPILVLQDAPSSFDLKPKRQMIETLYRSCISHDNLPNLQVWWLLWFHLSNLKDNTGGFRIYFLSSTNLTCRAKPTMNWSTNRYCVWIQNLIYLILLYRRPPLLSKCHVSSLSTTTTIRCIVMTSGPNIHVSQRTNLIDLGDLLNFASSATSRFKFLVFYEIYQQLFRWIVMKSGTWHTSHHCNHLQLLTVLKAPKTGPTLCVPCHTHWFQSISEFSIKYINNYWMNLH